MRVFLALASMVFPPGTFTAASRLLCSLQKSGWLGRLGHFNVLLGFIVGSKFKRQTHWIALFHCKSDLLLFPARGTFQK